MNNDYITRFRKSREKAGERSIATKILDLMKNLRLKQNDGSERRWVWELLQNAKDASYNDRKVAVEIDFQEHDGEGTLEFKHNGMPFTSDNITFLIEQVSNKDREYAPNQIKRPSGKFGTGFLTTHLLSEKVEVDGVLKEDGLDYRKFSIELDRSGRKLQDVVDSVNNSITDFEAINGQPAFNGFIPGDLNTTFRYKLDPKGIDVAKAGIADMQRAIPYTLAFLPEIEKVTLSSVDEHYILEKISPIDDGMEIITILKESTFDKEIIQIAVLRERDVSIAVEIEVMEGRTAIKNPSADLPTLFCDFPLVGSGVFHFPVVINCPTFNPNEPRNGIWLTEAEEDEVTENKDKISVAVVLLERLLQYASENSWGNTFNLFRIYEVEDQDWLSSQWFYEHVLIPVRKKLLTIPLVEIDFLGQMPILDDGGEAKVYFPSSENAEVRELLWDLSASIVPSSLTAKSDIHLWYQVLWDECPAITVERLAVTIKKRAKLSGLAVHFKGSENDAIEWLNSYYALLYKEAEALRLITDDQYPLIPNQSGDFRLLKDLKIGDEVEEELKNVLELFGVTIRNDLVHLKVITGDDIEYDPLSNETVIEQINKHLQTKGVDDITTLACHHLTTLFSPEGSFPVGRKTLYDLSKTIFPDKIGSRKHLKVYDADIWKESDKMQIKAIVKAIARYKNIETLRDGLQFRNSLTALSWLDKFVSLLVEHDLDSQLNLKAYPILPNQLGEFIIKDSVFLDSGDIAEELKSICADMGEDFREQLLDTNIYLILADNRTIGKKIIAEKIKDLVQPKLAELDRSQETRDLFKRLFHYFSKNKEEAEAIFGELFSRKHRLYDDEEISISLEKVEEITDLLQKYKVPNFEALKEILKSAKQPANVNNDEKMEITQEALAALGITSKEDLEKAVANGGLGDYFHISTPTIEMYGFAKEIIERSKRNIINMLRTLHDYNLDEMEELAPTILGGITHNDMPVYIVIRPSDKNMVLIYYPSEKDILDFTHAELWVDDGKHSPTHLTFGKILKITGINKIPVYGLY